ncbi:MAG: hypothetical protein ACP5TV_14165, partial [Anaerolineae bacterium]
IIGKTKAWTYVGFVALFSTLAGVVYGAWVDGAPAWRLFLYIAGGLALLVALLALIGRRHRVPQAAEARSSSRP